MSDAGKEGSTSGDSIEAQVAGTFLGDARNGYRLPMNNVAVKKPEEIRQGDTNF